MNNNLSKTKPNLTILLDKEVYFPGEKIKGHIRLDLASFIYIRGINLLLQSEEGWFINKHLNNADPEYNILYDDLINISDYTALTSDGFVIQAGEYVFEFTISLPEKILPSFEFLDYNKNYKNAKIRYILTSQLFYENESNESIKSTCYIIIKSNLNTLPPKQIEEIKSINKLNIGLTLEKSLYSPGDFLILTILIDNLNRSEIITECVLLNLVQNITFKNSNIKDNIDIKNILASKVIQLNCPKEEIKDLQNSFTLNSEEFNINDSYSYMNSCPHSYKKYLNNTIEFQPSIDGKLIKCEYCIEIEILDINGKNYKGPTLSFKIEHMIEKTVNYVNNKNNNMSDNKYEYMNNNEYYKIENKMVTFKGDYPDLDNVNANFNINNNETVCVEDINSFK